MHLVQIYFNMATYDKIERDLKVTTDPGGPAWPHRRHHGAPHWIFHPWWGQDNLLCHPFVHVPSNQEIESLPTQKKELL